MASSVATTLPLWLDGPTYDAVILRGGHVAASFFNSSAGQVYGGVLPSGGQMAVTPGSGMTVTVATGYAVCPNTSGSTYGGYLTALQSAATLTVATSDPTNPRVDLVVVWVDDLGTSSSAGAVQIYTGTPTAGATLSNLTGAPSAPANSVNLAYVLVPAGATSIVSGDLSSQILLTAAQGGIIPVTVANAPTGYTGNYIHDLTSGSFKHNPAAGPAQAKVLPWAPQSARSTTGFQGLSGLNTYLSVTITTDGSTDIEIIAQWRQVQTASGGSATWGQYGITMELAIDSSTVAEQSVEAFANGANFGGGGGTMHHITTSGVDRPTAGTHTIKWNCVPISDGTHAIQVLAGAGFPSTLYVKPVSL